MIKKQTLTVYLIGLLFFLLCTAAIFFKEQLWGLHALAFLDPSLAFIFAAFALLVLSAFFFQAEVEQHLSNFSLSLTPSMHLFISLSMGVIFYVFPMVEDFYGEAYLLNHQILETAGPIAEKTWDQIFSFSLNPWAAQEFIFAVITVFSYWLDISYYDIIIFIDALLGAAFVYFWTSLVAKHIKHPLLQWVLTIGVLFAPFMLNFYGHLEINAIVFVANLLWLIYLVEALDQQSIKKLGWLTLAVLLLLKIHPIAVFYLPIIMYLWLNQWNSRIFTLNWSSVLKYIVLPCFGLGLVFYFLVLKDHQDPRFLDYDIEAYDRLFLPIFSPEAPLDRYNLFSFNHVLDYFNEMMLWSPVLIIVLIAVVLFSRKQINWQNPSLIIVGTIFMLWFAHFFVSNPLLSMPMDWDLYAFPAMVLLVFTIVVLRQLKTVDYATPLLMVSLSVSILSIPFVLIHQKKETLSYRLETLGRHIFKTYYEWSANTIDYSLGLIPEDLDLQLERKNRVLYDLSPYAIEGNDREYGRMWAAEGVLLLNRQEYNLAYTFIKRSLDFYDSNKNRLKLLEACMYLEEYEEAFELSQQLLKVNFPNHQRALTAVIQVALFKADYQTAMNYCIGYLEKYPEDATMQEIYYRLMNDIELDELKNYFIIDNPK